jgi:RNA polymerase sigma-70 factor, ECF subfamily
MGRARSSIVGTEGPLGGHSFNVGASLASVPWSHGQHVEGPEKAGAFADLFLAHASFVWRVLRRLGVPEADAEDALQEVFLVVHHKLPTYEDRGSLRAWLFTIARQVASHHRRSTVRRERRELVTVPAPAPTDPHEEAVRREGAAIVRDFLEQLDEPRALVFLLADVEGMAVTEIASSLGVNLNTVYGRLRAARLRFEEFVDKRTKGARR